MLRTWALGSAVALTAALVACDDEEPNPRLCGWIARAVVTRQLTGNLEFRAIGDLREARDGQSADCQLVKGSNTFLTATVADVPTARA